MLDQSCRAKIKPFNKFTMNAYSSQELIPYILKSSHYFHLEQLAASVIYGVYIVVARYIFILSVCMTGRC